MAARNQDGKNQTKDLKCATHMLNEKFRNMSEEKKTIVRDLGFGGLMHIPPLRVHHQLLRELANNFKLGENRLKTGYDSFKIRQKIIGDALGINASGDLFPQKVNYKKLSEDDKEIFRRFQGKTLKSLTDEMMDIGVERNWGGHVLSFIIKGITDYKKEKKKAIDGYLFALMIIYFHLSKNKDKKRVERPPKPWIANWSKEQLVERMRAEIEENMSETQEDSEDSPRKESSKKGKKMDSKKRKKSQEDSDSESESTDETQSKKKKVVVEHSSPEQDQSYHGSEIGSEDLDELLMENNENSAAHGEKEANLRSTEGHYVSSETIPDVNLGSDDPSSQGHTEQSSVNRPAESMLSLVKESASEPADSNMMVVREETPFEEFQFKFVYQCPKQPLCQNFKKHMRQNMNQPLCYKLKDLQKPLLNPPQQLEESTPTLPPALSKITPEFPSPNNLKKAHPHFPQLHLKSPEDAAASMMMAWTASYVPETDPMPSFNLGFTDSSQEETTTQEGASTQDEHSAKTPETPKLLEQLEDLVHKIASGGVTKKGKSSPIPKESGAESFEKFETPVRPNLNTTDMKQKCYHWAIRVKTYANGLTDEFDNVCRLQAQDRYTMSKFHLASLAPKSHIEAEIVTAICFIVNQQNIQKFQEEVYCLPPDIVIFAPVCHSYHWWLWIADTRKRKFYIVDPLHNKSPSDARTVLNTFVDMDRKIVAPYLKISGQKTSYDCAIYVLKWLEILEPANIKRWKYECDNWTQDEVDHFRVEYASRILFHDMNLDKDEAIRGSNAIRLSKPSSLLLSPYC
ncbi:uncharacterized protein DS421_14g464470 [Arachis hypogaea]|nr:uncharacterized protein DS421_14g464470 [Arachis hypogaea]